jgi:iron complex outermembrane receptor protein
MSGLMAYYTNEYDDSKFDKQHSIGGNYYLKYLVNDRWSVHTQCKTSCKQELTVPLHWRRIKMRLLQIQLRVNQNAVAKLVDNTFNTSLTANYTGHRFNFSTQTSYQSNYRYYATPIDGDFSPADAITIINNYGNKWNNIKVVTEELRFTSPGIICFAP